MGEELQDGGYKVGGVTMLVEGLQGGGGGYKMGEGLQLSTVSRLG